MAFLSRQRNPQIDASYPNPSNSLAPVSYLTGGARTLRKLHLRLPVRRRMSARDVIPAAHAGAIHRGRYSSATELSTKAWYGS
jgi:hypothetical protein